MRVIVFGRQRTVQKLTEFLAWAGTEVVVTADTLDEMLALQKQHGFELAIVDGLAEKAEAAYHHIRESGEIPLVLIVSKRQPDWERIQSLDADGYLPEEAKDTELSARLRAILRRFWPAGQVKELTLNP